MSLNQLTNPASKFNLYANAINVPESRDVIDTAFLTSAKNIDSHCVKLGKMHVFFCRARFTPAGNPGGTNLAFTVTIPGFLFQSDDLKEMGILVRRGDYPRLSYTAQLTPAVGDPLPAPADTDGIAFYVDAIANQNVIHVVQQRRQVASPGGFVVVNVVNNVAYDIQFTITSLSA